MTYNVLRAWNYTTLCKKIRICMYACTFTRLHKWINTYILYWEKNPIRASCSRIYCIVFRSENKNKWLSAKKWGERWQMENCSRLKCASSPHELFKRNFLLLPKILCISNIVYLFIYVKKFYFPFQLCYALPPPFNYCSDDIDARQQFSEFRHSEVKNCQARRARTHTISRESAALLFLGVLSKLREIVESFILVRRIC